ncbi:hypothetical protein FACS1894181_14920 [Bacteroidia bacterium]|nr:hypothetical protein FACS1894181_14920 [Bacteroidia bacterium]
MDANGLFDLPVFGGEAGNNLVQVVNPYMAYLRISDFLANSTNDANFQSGYYIWNGDLKNGFTALASLNNGNRIEVTGNPVGPDPRLIPPLQSFFLAKKNPAAPVTSVVMSPSWTTTSPASSYSLRASTMVTNGGVLNITLSQGEKKAYAAMLYTPGATNFDTDKEDMPVLVYKDIPLTLYTFAYGKPLVINSSSQFAMRPVQLGLRATETGEAKLVFENLETFGYDVTLIDKVRNNERTNLNGTPEYTFTITKTGEINDRFSLEFSYTGKGVIITGNEAAQASALQVSGGAGYIHLMSNAGVIGNLQIYDAAGKLMYSAANLNECQFRLPVNGKQVYLVKATVGSEQIAEKVFVK